MADIVSLRALNDRLNASLHHVIEDLTDKQLGYCAPMIDERPIAAVAIHAYDNLCGFASIVAGQEWPPTPAEPTTVTELVTRLDEMYRLVDQVLAYLSSDALTQNIKLPWGQEIGGLDAIADGLAHGLVHAGALAGSRAMGGFPTPAVEY